MNAPNPLYSWFSPQQWQSDVSALQQVLVDRPDRQAQWLGVRQPHEARAFIAGLGLDDGHTQRLMTQIELGGAFSQLTQEFTQLTLPSASPDYGGALAPTPYQVIWQDSRAQLVCYNPTGHAAVLWVPAIINKHYVLDLCPQRSVIQRQCDLGLQVFSLVWRNPQGNPGPQEYLDTLHAALEFLSAPVHLAGYCLGGVLAAAAVSQGANVESLSLVASPLDGEMGELRHWFTPAQKAHTQQCAQARGCVPAGVLSAGFLSLKPRSWGGLFHQSRYPQLATWLVDGLDVSPAMWSWVTDLVYGPGGAMAAYPLAQIRVPVWSQSFDQDHLVPPQNFDCPGGVLNARAPGGHNGGLLRTQPGGWLDGWVRWMGHSQAIDVQPIQTESDYLRESGSAL